MIQFYKYIMYLQKGDQTGPKFLFQDFGVYFNYCNDNCVTHLLQNEDGTKTEYRIWNPFRSKLAAAVLGGVDNIWIVSLLHFPVTLHCPPTTLY